MVTIGELLQARGDAWRLELRAGADGLGNAVSIPRIQKPGLALAGYLPQIHPGARAGRWSHRARLPRDPRSGRRAPGGRTHARRACRLRDRHQWGALAGLFHHRGRSSSGPVDHDHAQELGADPQRHGLAGGAAGAPHPHPRRAGRGLRSRGPPAGQERHRQERGGARPGGARPPPGGGRRRRSPRRRSRSRARLRSRADPPSHGNSRARHHQRSGPLRHSRHACTKRRSSSSPRCSTGAAKSAPIDSGSRTRPTRSSASSSRRCAFRFVRGGASRPSSRSPPATTS